VENVGTGIAVDGKYNVYVTGLTDSFDFGDYGKHVGFIPIKNGFQQMPGGNHDAFVAKLDDTGNLIYSSYLGGPYEDGARSIAVDAKGNAYVTGSTFNTSTYQEAPVA